MTSIFLTLRDGTKVGNVELESNGIVSFEFLFQKMKINIFLLVSIKYHILNLSQISGPNLSLFSPRKCIVFVSVVQEFGYFNIMSKI